MAQPHKGDRRAYIVAIELAVRREIHSLATDSKLSVSQFVANHLAMHAGLPEFVEQPSPRFRPTQFAPDVKTVTIRCHNDVRARVAMKAAHAGYHAPAPYVVDFVTQLAKNGGVATEIEYAYQEELLTSA
ncbi:hypothetical protein BTO20_37790 (plasmid) [Mycobacterium dioxanotrophicus]|jgi:hypothetical protein|uniref:Uncharacterized protein n=1 Tax=Mycobacterium dioxanotrophicus TaxID=482462 RepID=A0A1Y0CH57_9MYCO|nr:hypothetical protein [Mycobacterium dioxanotrophicus]ART74374.1 hypothetical protein BTO20_37790 [Mycobacterium dioxanotrophicus]